MAQGKHNRTIGKTKAKMRKGTQTRDTSEERSLSRSSSRSRDRGQPRGSRRAERSDVRQGSGRQGWRHERDDRSQEREHYGSTGLSRLGASVEADAQAKKKIG